MEAKHPIEQMKGAENHAGSKKVHLTKHTECTRTMSKTRGSNFNARPIGSFPRHNKSCQQAELVQLFAA